MRMTTRLPRRSGALRFADFERIGCTVDAIVRSPAVIEYMIGITSRSLRQRQSEYVGKHGYGHLVFLATDLSADVALELEESLQLWIDHARQHAVYRKYEPTRRATLHRPSLGANRASPDDLRYSVYLSWLGQ